LNNDDLAVVIVARHHSTGFAYADAMRNKYGTPLASRDGFTDPATKQAPTVNVYRARTEELLRQGVHLAVCQMATRNLAGIVAKAVGADSEAIYKVLVGNLRTTRTWFRRGSWHQPCAGRGYFWCTAASQEHERRVHRTVRA
jgi:hypothetical protein